MFRQWLTLVIIVLVYIPVAIDATVLHVAAPTLSMTLGASGNELLWIIDIYSLVMAGMVFLPDATMVDANFRHAADGTYFAPVLRYCHLHRADVYVRAFRPPQHPG